MSESMNFFSESRMRQIRTSGLMSGGVETARLSVTAPPLDSTPSHSLLAASWANKPFDDILDKASADSS